MEKETGSEASGYLDFVPVTFTLPADYSLFAEEFRKNPHTVPGPATLSHVGGAGKDLTVGCQHGSVYMLEDLCVVVVVAHCWFESTPHLDPSSSPHQGGGMIPPKRRGLIIYI